jgi:hypothetical protein
VSSDTDDDFQFNESYLIQKCQLKYAIEKHLAVQKALEIGCARLNFVISLPYNITINACDYVHS